MSSHEFINMSEAQYHLFARKAAQHKLAEMVSQMYKGDATVREICSLVDFADLSAFYNKQASPAVF